MSIQGDIADDIEVTLGSIPYIKDYEIDWDDEVNIVPDSVDMRIWFDHKKYHELNSKLDEIDHVKPDNSAQLHGINFQPMPKRFMVWDKGLGKFLEHAGEKVYDLPLLTDLLDTYNVVEIHEDLVIAQSTNLFDKDGKEIFEGDIIVDHGYLVNYIHKLAGYVAPSTIAAGYTLLSPYKDYQSNGYILSTVNQYEVIGHILSSPELLEEK